MVLEVGNYNRTDSDESSVIDRNQMRKAGFENHIETDKYALSDAYSALAVEPHTQVLASRQKHGTQLKNSVNQCSEWILTHLFTWSRGSVSPPAMFPIFSKLYAR